MVWSARNYPRQVNKGLRAPGKGVPVSAPVFAFHILIQGKQYTGV